MPYIKIALAAVLIFVLHAVGGWWCRKGGGWAEDLTSAATLQKQDWKLGSHECSPFVLGACQIRSAHLSHAAVCAGAKLSCPLGHRSTSYSLSAVHVPAGRFAACYTSASLVLGPCTSMFVFLAPSRVEYISTAQNCANVT